MMMAPAGLMENVVGSNNAIAAVGPMPGRTPMSVPTKTPIKQKKRFAG
jgi:hypothetical protein